MALGGLTLAVRQVPVIWIGGLLFGGFIIVNAFRQWFRIVELDVKGRQSNPEQQVPNDDSNFVVFTCGRCSTKIRVKRGEGVTSIICPNCDAERRVRT